MSTGRVARTRTLVVRGASEAAHHLRPLADTLQSGFKTVAAAKHLAQPAADAAQRGANAAAATVAILRHPTLTPADRDRLLEHARTMEQTLTLLTPIGLVPRIGLPARLALRALRAASTRWTSLLEATEATGPA